MGNQCVAEPESTSVVFPNTLCNIIKVTLEPRDMSSGMQKQQNHYLYKARITS